LLQVVDFLLLLRHLGFQRSDLVLLDLHLDLGLLPVLVEEALRSIVPLVDDLALLNSAYQAFLAVQLGAERLLLLDRMSQL
jgi:hypothetical protein